MDWTASEASVQAQRRILGLYDVEQFGSPKPIYDSANINFPCFTTNACPGVLEPNNA